MKNKIINPNRNQYFDKIPDSRFDESDESEIYARDRHTLEDILAFVNKKGWQDYSKILIGSNNFPRSNSTYLYLEVSIPKTEQEMIAEQDEIKRKEREDSVAKENRKRKRQEKINAKAAALLKLSTEERKLLGY